MSDSELSGLVAEKKIERKKLAGKGQKLMKYLEMHQVLVFFLVPVKK